MPIEVELALMYGINGNRDSFNSCVDEGRNKNRPGENNQGASSIQSQMDFKLNTVAEWKRKRFPFCETGNSALKLCSEFYTKTTANLPAKNNNAVLIGTDNYKITGLKILKIYENASPSLKLIVACQWEILTL